MTPEGKKPCSVCPQCGKRLSRTFYTTSGLVFDTGACRDIYERRELKKERQREMAATRKRTAKKDAPVATDAPVVNMVGVHNAIRDLHYANEDRVITDLNEAVAMGVSLGGGQDDFMRQMVAYMVYKAAEHILRIEDGARLNPKADPVTLAEDVSIAKRQYVKALTAARKTLGADFDRLYEQARLEGNAGARSNLDSYNGMLYNYVVPKFYDDGTHEPLGPRDFPWGQVP